MRASIARGADASASRATRDARRERVKSRAKSMTSKRIVTRRARSRSIPGESGARDDGNSFGANPFASASATFDAREALRRADEARVLMSEIAGIAAGRGDAGRGEDAERGGVARGAGGEIIRGVVDGEPADGAGDRATDV